MTRVIWVVVIVTQIDAGGMLSRQRVPLSLLSIAVVVWVCGGGCDTNAAGVGHPGSSHRHRRSLGGGGGAVSLMLVV